MGIPLETKSLTFYFFAKLQLQQNRTNAYEKQNCTLTFAHSNLKRSGKPWLGKKVTAIFQIRKQKQEKLHLLPYHKPIGSHQVQEVLKPYCRSANIGQMKNDSTAANEKRPFSDLSKRNEMGPQ